MDILDLNTLLNKAQKDAGLYYIGIFVKGVEIISKTSSRSTNLSVHFGRLIEKSLELNEIMPTFKEEFLFSEGRDFSLFVYYVDGEVSIGIIHIGKPNFSLLKITAADLSKEISKHIPYIKQLYQEKIRSQQNQIPDKTSKESKFKSNYPEYISEIESVITSKSKEYEKKEHKKEDTKRQSDINIPSLEDILSYESKKDNEYIETPSFEEVVQSGIEHTKEHKKEDTKKQSDINIPSLEDILSYESKENKEDIKAPSFEEVVQSGIETDITDNDNIENYEEIIDKINREFIREIGPFGLYIFRRKKEQFFKDRSFNKLEILKFIQILSEEISIESKRQGFIEKAKSFLLNI